MSRLSSGGKPAAADALVWRGLQLHQAGNLSGAAALYEQALALERRHAEANHLLGVVRLAERRLDEALTYISRALEQQPRNPQYLGNMGVALNAAGQYEAAIKALDRAIALRPDFAEAYSNRGMAQRALGQYDEAARSYEEAIKLKPAEAGFRFNLANSLDDAGRAHEAHEAVEAALRLNPRHVGALAARVRILQSLRRYDQALASAKAAAAAMPDQVELLKSLAQVLEKTGDVERSVAVYRRALELDPNSGSALYHLAYRVHRRERDAEVEAMQRVFRDAKQSRTDRARAGHALGKVLADLGDHQASFDAYVEANALHRQDQPYSLHDALAQIKAIMTDFADVPARLQGVGYRGASPIFVVGLPRAGKTTIEMLLDRNPAAWAGGELGRLRQLVLELQGDSGRASAASLARPRLAAIPPERIAAAGESYARYVADLAPPGARTIDTMPPNFLLVGYIRLLLPEARIIHAVRDPLDHAVAQFEKYFLRSAYGYSTVLSDLRAYYAAYRRMMCFWEEQSPGGMLEVDVSRLQRDPAQVRNLYSFCGLDWVEGGERVGSSEPRLGEPEAEDVEAGRRRHLEVYRDSLGVLASHTEMPPRGA